MRSYSLACSVLLIAPAEFSGKIVGMLLSAALVGFVIGSVVGVLFSFLIGGFKKEPVSTKPAMVVGGILGAIAGIAVLAYFIFFV